MYGCHLCHDPLSDEEEVIAAVTLHHIETMGAPPQDIEGLGVFFHPDCWPGDGFGYRFRDVTTVPEAVRVAPPRPTGEA